MCSESRTWDWCISKTAALALELSVLRGFQTKEPSAYTFHMSGLWRESRRITLWSLRGSCGRGWAFHRMAGWWRGGCHGGVQASLGMSSSSNGTSCRSRWFSHLLGLMGAVGVGWAGRGYMLPLCLQIAYSARCWGSKICRGVHPAMEYRVAVGDSFQQPRTLRRLAHSTF